MSESKQSLCKKICKYFTCHISRRTTTTTKQLPKDISDTLSDVNLSTCPSEPKSVNSINNDYKTDYGTASKKPVPSEKKVNTEEDNSPRKKIQLSIDNDYIRKSSDNLECINSPRETNSESI
jgi:hypothetical protein